MKHSWMVLSFKSASFYHAELFQDLRHRQNLEGPLLLFGMDHLLADRLPIVTEVHLLVVEDLDRPAAEEVVRMMIAMFLEAHTQDPDLLLGGLERGHFRILGHHLGRPQDIEDQHRYPQDDVAEAAVTAPTAVEVDHVAPQGVVREVVAVIKGEGSCDCVSYLEHLERGAEVQGKRFSGTSKGLRPIVNVLHMLLNRVVISCMTKIVGYRTTDYEVGEAVPCMREWGSM